MTSRQCSTLALLTVVAGFLGGAVSDRLLRGDPSAAAQGAPPPPAVPGEVTATRFRRVDAEGWGRAALEVDADAGSRLRLYDAAGKPIWSVP